MAFYLEIINSSLMVEPLSIEKISCFRNLILNLACNLNDDSFVQLVDSRNLTRTNLLKVLKKLVVFMKGYFIENRDRLISNGDVILNSHCLDLCLVVNCLVENFRGVSLKVSRVDKEELLEETRSLNDLLWSISGIDPFQSASMIFERVGYAILDFKGEIRKCDLLSRLRWVLL